VVATQVIAELACFRSHFAREGFKFFPSLETAGYNCNRQNYFATTQDLSGILICVLLWDTVGQGLLPGSSLWCEQTQHALGLRTARRRHGAIRIKEKLWLDARTGQTQGQ
jgi:hypothetical protein